MKFQKPPLRPLTAMQMMAQTLSLNGKKMTASPRPEDVDVAEVHSEVANVVVIVEDIEEATRVVNVEDSEEVPMVNVEDIEGATRVVTVEDSEEAPMVNVEDIEEASVVVLGAPEVESVVRVYPYFAAARN